MSASIFLADGPRRPGRERFVPTEQARGPWDARALHGGAPAALITAAFERLQPGADLRIGRLGFEFLRPIPMAPLTLSTRIARPGRRVQELSAELLAGEEPVVRASAVRVQAVPEQAGATAREVAAGESFADAAMPPPADGEHKRFALNDRRTSATASAPRCLSSASSSSTPI